MSSFACARDRARTVHFARAFDRASTRRALTRGARETRARARAIARARKLAPHSATMCNRYAFFDAQSWLTALERSEADDADAEEEELFRGACSVSRSRREQYDSGASESWTSDGTTTRSTRVRAREAIEEDGEDAVDALDDTRGYGKRFRGALAEDAEHSTFARGTELSDPAAIAARFVAVRARDTPASDGTTGSTSANMGSRARLECELDGRRYRLSMRTCRGIVASLEEKSSELRGESMGKDFPRYLSLIFPHVTLNIFSNAEDASWDGLRVLERALRDPALAGTLDEREATAEAARVASLGARVVPKSIGDDIDVEEDIVTASAFAAQRFAADALVDVADALETDPEAWTRVSARALRHGVRDVFVDDPGAYELSIGEEKDEDEDERARGVDDGEDGGRAPPVHRQTVRYV